MHETELHSELQRLKTQMKAIDASIAAARSQLENLKKEDERTVWETNIVILKASHPHAALVLSLYSSHACPCPCMLSALLTPHNQELWSHNRQKTLCLSRALSLPTAPLWWRRPLCRQLTRCSMDAGYEAHACGGGGAD